MLLFQPAMLSRSDASTLARFIMNYLDQVLLADALFALHQRRTLCLEQLQQENLAHLPVTVCPSSRRHVSWEKFYEAPPHVKLAHNWY
jgi:hypothetical protein